MITQERLQSILHYEPSNGKFTRLAGDLSRPVGTVTENGYLRINVDGKIYYAQRLAFLYMTGEWPGKYADHINGDTLDNRWCNLRDADPTQSLANRIVSARNSASLKNVSSFIDRRYMQTYMVGSVSWNGKNHRVRFNANKLGILEATYAAACAVKTLREQLHGEFACHGSRSSQI